MGVNRTDSYSRVGGIISASILGSIKKNGKRIKEEEEEEEEIRKGEEEEEEINWWEQEENKKRRWRHLLLLFHKRPRGCGAALLFPSRFCLAFLIQISLRASSFAINPVWFGIDCVDSLRRGRHKENGVKKSSDAIMLPQQQQQKYTYIYKILARWWAISKPNSIAVNCNQPVDWFATASGSLQSNMNIECRLMWRLSAVIHSYGPFRFSFRFSFRFPFRFSFPGRRVAEWRGRGMGGKGEI